jgi:hypothetical protein
VDEFGNIRAENEMEYVDIVAARYMRFSTSEMILQIDRFSLNFLAEMKIFSRI